MSGMNADLEEERQCNIKLARMEGAMRSDLVERLEAVLEAEGIEADDDEEGYF